MKLWLLVLAMAAAQGGQAMASSDNGLPENHHEFAAAIARGQEHRPIVDVADAEAYAARITAATYGEAETKAQLPFHAVSDGDRWKMTGSRPMNIGTMSGPLTIVVGREDGAVWELAFTLAPVGWDAALRRSGPAPR